MNLTLNLLAKQIQREQGYSRAQAYRRATVILDELERMDRKDQLREKADDKLLERGKMKRFR